MPNIADPKFFDPKCSKELSEEDLEQVSGGVQDGINVPKGQYSIYCLLQNCGELFQKFVANNTIIDPNTAFGTCSKCGATIYLASESTAIIKKGSSSAYSTVYHSGN